jgi:ABC-type nitrate/sulfonate/bicarbonate transport system permease component
MMQLVKKKNSVIYMLLSFLIFLFLWELSLTIFDVSKTVIIRPTVIIQTLVSEYDIILEEMLYTAKEVLLGWGIGNAVGILTAISVYRNEEFSKKLLNLFVLVNAVPLIALSAILGGILGTGLEQKVLIVSLVVFFPTFLTALSQLKNTSRDSLDLFLTYAAKERAIFKYLRFPSSIPAILNCIKVSVITAMFTAITAEFFGGHGGIGIFILSKKGLYNLPMVWASIFCIAIFGTIFYFSVELLQRKLVTWQKS